MPDDKDFIDDFIVEDIEENLSDIVSANIVHDKYQFESKFDFDLKPHGKETAKHYTIDLYFFIPKTMGINSDTYTRDHFYTDLTNYLRIQTPELFNWHKLPKAQQRLPVTDQYFKVHLIPHQRQKIAGAVVQEVKLFGCFIDTQLKKLQAIIARLIKRNKDSASWHPSVIEAIVNRINSIRDMLQTYREQYLTPIKNQAIMVDSEIRKPFFLVDEYNSYRLEIVFISLCQILDSNSVTIPQVKSVILDILAQESQYRTTMNIVNLDHDHGDKVRETYYYRLGLVKKYVLEVLYLQSKNIKKEHTYRNIIAGFGAALAAIWAGVIDIKRIQMIGNVDPRDVWTRLAAVLLIGVIAYVFKDRIKEISKEYFNQKLKQYLPDFDIKMFYSYFNGDNEQTNYFVGSCKEFFRYLPKTAIPPEIAYLRDIGNRSDLDPVRDENIIHYSKKLDFVIGEQQSGLGQAHIIRDIARFDISDFLAKLDNPKKSISYYDQAKGIVVMEAPKVYHINVVLRYACNYRRDDGSAEENVEFERIRLILNKKGISRIEEVLRRGAIKYSENTSWVS